MKSKTGIKAGETCVDKCNNMARLTYANCVSGCPKRAQYGSK